MNQSFTFQNILDTLLDEKKPFSALYLTLYSDIEPANLNALLEIWPQVSLKRKRILLENLEELAETDTLMSFEDLGRAFLDDPDAQVRALAIHLLWECEDAKLAPIYLDILNKDADREVSAAAASALGLFTYLGEIEEIPEQLHKKVEEGLLNAARHAKHTLVRRRALEALGVSSRPEVPQLIEAAYHEKEPDWVVSALFAIGRSSDNRWEKQILSKLRAHNATIRVEAARAAGELTLPSARQPLLDLLEDEEDTETRHEIIWALTKLGGEGVRERLDELFEAEMDSEEANFLEEAMDNLAFTEDMASFDMFDFEQDMNKENLA